MLTWIFLILEIVQSPEFSGLPRLWWLVVFENSTSAITTMNSVGRRSKKSRILEVGFVLIVFAISTASSGCWDEEAYTRASLELT